MLDDTMSPRNKNAFPHRVDPSEASPGRCVFFASALPDKGTVEFRAGIPIFNCKSHATWAKVA